MREASVEATVKSVRSLLNEANGLADRIFHHGDPDDWWFSCRLCRSVATAFTQLLLLTEALGFERLHTQIQKSFKKAERDGLGSIVADPDGDPHLKASSDLRRYLVSIEAVYGLESPHIISKDVIEVLRATQYAITDRNCFSKLPASESDVHNRVEAVLKCIFPDLKHTPAISKPIKNFKPDTGLPSTRTLLEYKFIQQKADVDRVVDEILADTRGYISSEWDSFVFLIYETCRLKPEREWNDLLRECGTAMNTQTIVICGEVPIHEIKSPKEPRSRRVRDA